MNRWSLLANRPRHSPGHAPRPSISSPYGFRRLDQTDAQRQSLVPLRLGPVVLRESPVPPEARSPVESSSARNAVHERSSSTEDLLVESERPQSYRINRDSPFNRYQQQSSTVWPLQPPPPAAVESEHRTVEFQEQRAARPAVSSRSSSSSLRRANEASTPSSLSSRPSHERMRPKRKRSQQSVRRSGSDIDDQELEKGVMELNTIVEERRAEAARGSTPDHHIAAIAPTMQVRARAETLDAIGSGLARPLTAQAFSHDPMRSEPATERPVLRRSASTTLRTSSRVSGWLSGIFPSASSSHLPSGEPFYKCQPRPRLPQRSLSENSICSSVAESESPSLTVASSPTSKGHSRSHTGESRLTPLWPPATYHDPHSYGELDVRKAREDHWPVVMTPTSQVGLAL